MLKHIIFDFDGTVVDSATLYIKLANDMADELKISPLIIDSLRELSGLTIKQRCKKLNIPLYRLPVMNMMVQDKIKNHMHKLQWIPGIEDEILKLKDMGYKLAMISSNSVTNINRFFENHNSVLFDEIYSSRGIFDKHLAIKALLKKFKIKRSEAIYIGDEFRDIKACKRAKVKIISVTWGYDSKELLLKGKPDFIADTPVEISNIICKLSGDGKS